MPLPVAGSDSDEPRGKQWVVTTYGSEWGGPRWVSAPLFRPTVALQLCFSCPELLLPRASMQKDAVFLVPSHCLSFTHLFLKKTAHALFVLKVFMKMTVCQYTEPNRDNNKRDVTWAPESYQVHLVFESSLYSF